MKSGDEKSSNKTNETPSWQQEIRLLLDPTVNRSAKEVLIQDLAKQAPEILSETCTVGKRKLGLDGIAQLFGQFQQDILPDLVTNGPRYAARAADELPRYFSKMTSNTPNSSNLNTPSFSIEDVQTEVRNIFNRTPEGLFTPNYQVVGEFDGYEIRKYPSIILAETSMVNDQSPNTVTEVESAAIMGSSFQTLAGYLFGKNEGNISMKMTTPVVLSKGAPEESMSFIIGEYQRVEDIPKTLDKNITLREQAEKIFAVTEFSGFVTQGEAKRQHEKLLKLLSRDNISLKSEEKQEYKCMIYNGPSTLPNLRRNEMMIEVDYPREN